MIDQGKKKALIELIKEKAVPDKAELLLPLELFFDGYDEARCTICVNNRISVSTARFLGRMRTVQARPEVAGVFVRIFDYADAEEDEECWISSDSIYLTTTASLSEVREWFADFEVSDVWEEENTSKFAGLPPMPNGFRLVAVWWD